MSPLHLLTLACTDLSGLYWGQPYTGVSCYWGQLPAMLGSEYWGLNTGVGVTGVGLLLGSAPGVGRGFAYWPQLRPVGGVWLERWRAGAHTAGGPGG